MCHHNPYKRALKLAELRKLAKGASIVCLQEVHGTFEEIVMLLHMESVHYHIFHTMGKDRSTGGNLTLISKSFFINAHIHHEELIQGRVQRTCITSKPLSGSESRLWVYNVHNFGLSTSELNRVTHRIASDKRQVSNAPLTNAMVLVWDWNFHAAGESHKSLSRPCLELNAGDAVANYQLHRQRWLEVLSDLIEIAQLEPTHFTRSTDATARLDRAYVAAPAWIVALSGTTCHSLDDPVTLDAEGISDHSAVKISFSRVPARSAELQAIPAEIFRSKQFLEQLQHLENVTHFDDMDVIERWQTHKTL